VQAGTGTTTLAGTHTYTGNTLVNAGTLLVNGSVASSSTVVNTNGSLGGSGTVASIVLNLGGAVTPGNSIGTLNTNNGALVWNGQTSGTFGQMKFELANGSNSSDLLNLGLGVFDKGTGSVFSFDFLGTGGNGFTYTLVNFGSTDFVVSDFGYTNLSSGLTGSFVQNANSLQFVTSVIPEPSTVLLAGLGLAFVLWRGRRRVDV
jgi:autotransporter-associated beta strand protein